MIYLDYAANTPIDKEVLDYYYEISQKYYGNPNSVHKIGRAAKEIIDKATENIAKNFGVSKEEIIYTSGATESNNMVIKGICERYKNNGKHIIVSSLEHNSIIASATVMQDKGFDVDLVPVNKEGLIDIEELKKLIRKDTILVSIVSVDSEIGLVQPIEEIAKFLRDYPNIHFHTDATQAVGKVKIDYSDVDLITFSPHKFYGVNGIGVLIKKKNTNLIPIISGGKSTTVYRSGTPVTPLIASVDKALDIALTNQENRYNYVLELNKRIINHLKKYDYIHINNTDKSIPFTINFSIRGIHSKDFAKMLEEKDIYISTKTSCCPENTPSKLVYALTKDKSLAATSLRVSLSHLTTNEEINSFLNTFDECIEELKKDGKI
ncbi:MAG: cysteine desulfurase [Firmicutes bacterium]|jgi:cysteine desulfurase|nr:cysteine desulfurase [Bacillota bacterium]